MTKTLFAPSGQRRCNGSFGVTVFDRIIHEDIDQLHKGTLVRQ